MTDAPGGELRVQTHRAAVVLWRARLRLWLNQRLNGLTTGFGHGWHGFRLGRRASRSEIEAFEGRWKVVLPAAYRSVLERIGNGGAGPFYGLSTLAGWHQPNESDDAPPDLLQRPFDPGGGAAGTPPGCLRVANAGCEHYYVLVLTGPQRGEVWHDATVDGRGVVPVPGPSGSNWQFGPWYTAWLEGLATSADDGSSLDPSWQDRAFPGHALAQAAAGLGPGGTIAVDQLPCPACVRIAKRSGARVIVPFHATALENPKQVALRAARGRIQARPREVPL